MSIRWQVSFRGAFCAKSRGCSRLTGMRAFVIMISSLLAVAATACHRSARVGPEAKILSAGSIRTFVTGDAIITARQDGWVEVRRRRRPVQSLDYDEYFQPRELYRPSEVRAWVIRARSTFDTAKLGGGTP